MKLSICFERSDGSASEHESSFPYELTDAQVASIFREVLVLAEAAVRKGMMTTSKMDESIEEKNESAPHTEAPEEAFTPSTLKASRSGRLTKGEKKEQSNED